MQRLPQALAGRQALELRLKLNPQVSSSSANKSPKTWVAPSDRVRLPDNNDLAASPPLSGRPIPHHPLHLARRSVSVSNSGAMHPSMEIARS